MRPKLHAAIIGSGNIGTDILLKLKRSGIIKPVLFIGRNANSSGIKMAKEMCVKSSINGEKTFEDASEKIDIIFDATSALSHLENIRIYEKVGKYIINLTPANIGFLCIPAINLKETKGNYNINMVTCGGQASIPIAYAINKAHNLIDYVEVVSSISSKSAGPATRINIDEYIGTTENALKEFCQITKTKAILNINPAEPCVNMKTTVFAKIENPKLHEINHNVKKIVKIVQQYAPGYRLVVEPWFDGKCVMCTVETTGQGDYLPRYAGNLDIITSAAISVAENIASNWERN